MSGKAKLKTNEEVWSEQMEDPQFAAIWQRTALARAVAIAACRYRADNSLTQQQLADELDWPQSSVARLEAGDHNPTLETLAHLSATLGLQFNISIIPTGAKAKLSTKRAQNRADNTKMGQAVVAIASD